MELKRPAWIIKPAFSRSFRFCVIVGMLKFRFVWSEFFDASLFLWISRYIFFLFACFNSIDDLLKIVFLEDTLRKKYYITCRKSIRNIQKYLICSLLYTRISGLGISYSKNIFDKSILWTYNLTLTAEIRKKACNLFRSKLLLLHENNRNMVG